MNTQTEPTRDAQIQMWAGAFNTSGKPKRTEGHIDAYVARIERIVQRMERQGRWKEAGVLRAESVLGDRPEQERIAHLARCNVELKRSAYYAYLKSARAFLDGALPVEPLWEQVTVWKEGDDAWYQRLVLVAGCPNLFDRSEFRHELGVGDHFGDEKPRIYCSCGWIGSPADSDEAAVAAHNGPVGLGLVPVSEWELVGSRADGDVDGCPF